MNKKTPGSDLYSKYLIENQQNQQLGISKHNSEIADMTSFYKLSVSTVNSKSTTKSITDSTKPETVQNEITT